LALCILHSYVGSYFWPKSLFSLHDWIFPPTDTKFTRFWLLLWQKMQQRWSVIQFQLHKICCSLV
jgi:hypothetical protein